jgi:drug/metabolite transporter (DMT)-like permease
LIKFGLELGASFLQVFLFEVLFATIVFGSFWRRFFAPVRPRGWAQWGRLLALGFGTVGVGTFLFMSFSLGPVAIPATLMFLYLPVVYFFSVLAGHQRFDAVKLAAILSILVGAALTTEIFQTLDQPGVIPAALSAAAASASYAVIFVLTPAVGAYTTLAFRSFAVCLMGMTGTVLILICIPSLWFPLGGNLPAFAVLVLFLGILGQVLPVFTLMKGLPLTGGSLGGVLASVELPVAIFSAALILGESLHFWKIMGVVLVFLGIVVYNFADRVRVPAVASSPV